MHVVKVTVDAASIAAHQADGGGHRRVLNEEVSCDKNYVRGQTTAISTECPHWGSRVCRSDYCVVAIEFCGCAPKVFGLRL